MKSDLIITANRVYLNLRDARDVFAMEADVIGHARCTLLTHGELEDFHTGRYEVTVLRNSEGYDLYAGGYRIRLAVFDRQIVSFMVSANY